MKAPDYIKAMQALIDEHGDLEVDRMFVNGNRQPANPPEIAFRKVLNSRESKPEFWHEFLRGEGRKGDKVIRV